MDLVSPAQGTTVLSRGLTLTVAYRLGAYRIVERLRSCVREMAVWRHCRRVLLVCPRSRACSAVLAVRQRATPRVRGPRWMLIAEGPIWQEGQI